MENLPQINQRPLNLSSKKEVPVYLTQNGLLEYPTDNMSNATDLNNNTVVENNAKEALEKDPSPDQDESSKQVSPNENTASKTRSFACVSCSYISTSVEALGSHFIDKHFLDPQTTDNNNNVQVQPLIDYDHKKFRKLAKSSDDNNNPIEATATVTIDQKSVDELKTDTADYGATYENLAKKKKAMKMLKNSSKNSFKMMVQIPGQFATEEGCLDLSIRTKNNAKPDASNQNSVDKKESTSHSTKFEKQSKEQGMDELDQKISREDDGLAPDNANLWSDIGPTSNDVGPMSNQDCGLSKTDEDEANKRHTEEECGGCSKDTRDVELFSCLICARSYPFKVTLIKHLNKIHQLNNLCRLCYFNDRVIMRFANPVSLRNHKLRAHPSDMVRCDCGAMLCDEKLLLAHKKKFKCYLNDEERIRHGMVRCICGKRFETNEQLVSHKTKCRKRYSQDEANESVGLDYSYKKRRSDAHTPSSTCSSASHTNKSEKYFKEDNDMHNSVYDTGNLNDLNMKDENNNFSKKEMSSDNCKRLNQYISNPKKEPWTEHTLSEKEYFYHHGYNPDIRPQDELRIDPKSHDVGSSLNLNFGQLKRQKCEKKKVDVGKAFGDSSNNSTFNDQNRSLEQNSNKCSGKKSASSKKSTNAVNRKATHDGRYPCKICGQRFKRPYLYSHQKYVHQPKTWVFVESRKSSGPSKHPFSCGWCSYHAKDMKAIVYHHYSKHQQLELDVKTNV